MKSISFGLAVVMIVVLLVATIPGCAKPAVKISEWNVPVIANLTGPAAPYGLDRKWSCEYTAKLINDAGGVNGIPIKITAYDEPADAAAAVTVMTQVLATKPLLIVGPLGPATGACGYLPANEGVPFIGAFSDAAQLAQYKSWGFCGTAFLADMVKVSVNEWARLNPDIKSVVILCTPELFVEFEPAAKDEFTSLGIKVLDIVDVSPPGALDLGPIATRVMALKPDGYCCGLISVDQANLCKAMFERGMTEGKRIFMFFVSLGAPLFELGKGYLEDTYVWDMVDYTSTNPTWVAYLKAYADEHDGNLPFTPANYGGCNSILAFKYAIEHLGITGDPAKLAEERVKIRDFLLNAEDIPNITGGTWGYVNGAVKIDLFMFQIKDNKLTLASKVAAK